MYLILFKLCLIISKLCVKLSKLVKIHLIPQLAKRKSSGSRASLAHDNTDSDSSADSTAEPRSPHRTPPKARRTLSTREVNAWAVGDQSPSASTDPTVTGQTPAQVRLAATPYRQRSCKEPNRMGTPPGLQEAKQNYSSHRQRDA